MAEQADGGTLPLDRPSHELGVCVQTNLDQLGSCAPTRTKSALMGDVSAPTPLSSHLFSEGGERRRGLICHLV